MKTFFALLTFIALVGGNVVCATDIRGKVNVEHRQFFADGAQGQESEQTSVAIEPELFWQYQDGDASFTFKPFVRIDSLDDNRTHVDVRELIYFQLIGDYELHAGIGKVYWGVTESQHLVDVINQTDTIESIDREEKLGQPMIQLSAIKEWGVLEGFILPYFREQTYTGEEGRFRAPLVVNDQATYQSSAEEYHVDVAARYSQSYDDWDIGLSAFNGTNREPYFSQSGSQLVPHYAQMTQLGLDAQGIVGDWLLKLELIHRDSLDNHTAMTSGFEYTWVGPLDSFWDVGLIAEYLYDSRDQQAPTPSQNDLFIGSRLAFNDQSGTEVLFGITQDLDDSQSRVGKLEASSRINNAWKWRIDAWWFESENSSDPVYMYRKDDVVELALEYYF